MIMNFDDMLGELGELGKFQLVTYFLICLPVMFSGANSLSYVFTAGVPNYRCYVPECENASVPYFHEEWVPYAIPNDNQNDEPFKPAQCTKYVYKTVDKSGCSKDDFLSETESCSKWVYDNERTIVNDWNITCKENQIKLSFVGNTHFIGIMIGSIMFGVLSDRFGRKNMFIFSIILMSLAGVGHIVSTGYIMFLVITLVHAIGTSGVYPLGFILAVEMVGRSKREFIAIVMNFFYATGEGSLGIIAWLVPDWTIIQIIISAPSIIFCVYFCFIPESIRWLMAKKKNQQAKAVMLRAAKMNKVTLSEGLLDSFKEVEDQKEEENKVKVLPVIKEILKSRKLMIRYSIVCYVWLAIAFIYYGLSLNSTSMVGNKYLNYVLSCLVEIPGYMLSWLCIVKVGRKFTLIVSMFFCAANCAASIFIKPGDLSWLLITLFLLGKLAITAAFGCIYVYTAEMYPTVIRSGGVAMSSTLARIGSFLAPFVPLLGIYVGFMPMLVFAIVATFAAGLAFKLPETLKKQLPETVEDALNV